MAKTTDWKKAIKPLIRKYKNKKHPLDYRNDYQLLVMVVLSARSSDAYINQIAPALFGAYPDFKSIAAKPEGLYPLIKGVPGGRKKAEWIIGIAKEIKSGKAPVSMNELIHFSGIGRKSANVIMREAGAKAEGIIVDLHVMRVAPRLGIATGTDPEKIEQQLMKAIDPKDWGEAGMAISFLGREICRPAPMCPECIMRPVCNFYLAGEYEKMMKQQLNKEAIKKMTAAAKKKKKKKS
ncbi:MAG: endonuclease III [Chitinophagaceae bacterium]|nr:endonuclease III [Chitinophagaceae bacterium]